MTDRPHISSAAWTFSLKGPCQYCGKKVTRQRTFGAATSEQAQAMADRAMQFLAHRKCEGF